jgi:hypothetical protein
VGGHVCPSKGECYVRSGLSGRDHETALSRVGPIGVAGRCICGCDVHAARWMGFEYYSRDRVRGSWSQAIFGRSQGPLLIAHRPSPIAHDFCPVHSPFALPTSRESNGSHHTPITQRPSSLSAPSPFSSPRSPCPHDSHSGVLVAPPTSSRPRRAYRDLCPSGSLACAAHIPHPRWGRFPLRRGSRGSRPDLRGRSRSCAGP